MFPDEKRAGLPACSAATRSNRLFRPSTSLLLMLVIVACIVALQRHVPQVPDQPQHRVEVQEKARQLDSKYASNLVLQNAKYEDAHQPVVDPSISRHSAAIVMGRLSNETKRVQWVYDQLRDIDRVEIYTVDDPSSPGPHLTRNHGREAAVYLNYIIDHYDNLTDVTFFWHNGEFVWHNNLLLAESSVQTINRMKRDYIVKSGYAPSRCDHWPGCPAWIRFNPSRAEHVLDPHRLEEMFNPQLFGSLFPGVTDFPPYFAGTCCSQFAVSRNAIHSRSIETYQAILAWVLEFQDDDNSGMVLEYTWPYLFTGRGALCPSMEACYCKTYGICLEEENDVEQLKEWNDLRTRREEIKWQLTFYEEALEQAQQAKEAASAPEEEVIAIEQHFQPEIDRTAVELERLANNTWSARESLIHHWRLPAPVVGW